MRRSVKLFAIPHDGTLEGGDSLFFPPEHKVSYVPGMDLAQLKKAVSKLKELSEDPEFSEDVLSQIKGAWVVDQSIVNALNRIEPSFNDSVSYGINNACKILLNGLAKKFIGKRPK